ncbi:glycosyltransferase [bacterium]|nr:glycosyltransferase [bacterium]
MRNVLFIVTSFPPNCGIAGIRIGCYAKYLQKLGWNPIILKLISWPQHNDPEIVKNLDINKIDIYDLEKYGDGYGANLFFNKRRKSFTFDCISYGRFPILHKARSIKQVKEIFKLHDIDVIFSSFPYPEAFIITDWASKRYKVPWVSDFRDVIEEYFTGNILRYIKYREHSYVKSASELCTVSQGCKKILSARYPAPVNIIYNGYDPDDYTDIELTQPDKFIISYTGNIVRGQDPSLFLQAIDELITGALIDASDIEVNFYGVAEYRINNFTASLDNSNIINCLPRIKRKDIIKIQVNSTLLLLLADANPVIEGTLTGKLFEYLGAKRPIISIPSYKDIDVILEKTGAGISFSTKDEVKKYITRTYNEWKLKGKVEYNGKIELFKEYTRSYQGQQLAEILDRVVKKEGKKN